ncbi:MAG: tyrosine-type recombinase/integrase [Phycisphaerales bacterium JB050]
MVSINAQWVKARMDDAQTNATRGDGVTEANRLRSLLSMILTEWCRQKPGAVNPILNDGVELATNKDGVSYTPRENKLEIEQAREYARAIERYAAGEGLPGRVIDSANTKRLRRATADFLLLNMRVGLRRGNGLGLRWEWIDFAKGEITIPAERVKNKRKLTVPVPPEALAMLERRRAEAIGPYAWVFPGRRDPSKPMSEPTKAHQQVLTLAGLPKDICTIHDMRRTLGSAILETGGSIVHAQKQLGHSNPVTTGIYLHSTSTKTQDALRRVSAAFDAEVEEENAA